MYDYLLQLQTLTTQTTGYTATAIDLGTGTPRRGLKARIRTKKLTASFGITVQYKLQDSADNTTFYDMVYGTPLTAASASTKTDVQFLNFETSRRYVRAIQVPSDVTSTMSLIYKIEIGDARP